MVAFDEYYSNDEVGTSINGSLPVTTELQGDGAMADRFPDAGRVVYGTTGADTVTNSSSSQER